MNDSIPLRPLASLTVALNRHDELLARLDADEGDGETQALERLVPELQAFLGAAAATGTIVEDFGDRTKLQAVSDYWANVLRRVGHEVARTRLEPFDPQSLPELDDDACPYVGSEPIRVAEHYFGREADIREILDRVGRESILIVRGPSGSGKSSLLHAGVLPKLPSERRVVVSMRPGASPFARLAKALGVSIGRELSGRELRNNPARIRDVLADSPPVVLCIDQFEEMFILAKDGDRSAFDGLLKTFLDASADNRLILCVDDGLVDTVAQMPRLADRLDREHAQHAVNPLDSAAIERAIVRPAAQVNLELKQGVIEHLMRDLPRGPSALPILQFMLRRLWAARDRNRVTLAALQAIGDPCEAFDRDAERRFDALTEAGANADEIRRVLLEMVRIDDLFDHHRQCVSIETLRAIDGVDLARLLPLLGEHGFLRVIDGEFTEIPDEAYVHHWKRLVAWIKKHRQPSRSAREALARAAQAWEANNYSDAGLLRRTEIAEAQKLGRLTELEQRFVSASGEQIERVHAERDRSRRQSIMVLALMVFLLLVTVLALGIAWHSREKSFDAEIQASIALVEVIQADAKVEEAQTEAKVAEGLAKVAEAGTKKAQADADEANAKALEAQLEMQTVAQDLQIRIKAKKPNYNQLISESEALVGSLERDAADAAEQEIQRGPSKGDFWLQVASDNSLEDAQSSLRSVSARLESHGINAQFLILKRRAYYVLMVGPYPTLEAAKEAAAPEDLYPHGRFIRVLDSFCPGRVRIEGAEVAGGTVVECRGVPPLRK